MRTGAHLFVASEQRDRQLVDSIFSSSRTKKETTNIGKVLGTLVSGDVPECVFSKDTVVSYVELWLRQGQEH
jgi:hypothetical protein